MTPEEKLNELAAYRLRQAEESLDEAAYLLAGGKSPRAVINRAYYSMFYAVLALLIYEEFASSKHTGVIAWFNRNYIKTGKFPTDPGIYLTKRLNYVSEVTTGNRRSRVEKRLYHTLIKRVTSSTG